MKENEFLEAGYEVPKEKKYFKFQDGENTFRIISKPIIGWLDWKEKKPLRFKMTEMPKSSIDPSKPIKHFWAMCVWNYKEQLVQVLEITQKSIQTYITTLSKNPKWGSPLGYDIVITRKGSGMETEYTCIAEPPSVLPSEIQDAIIDFGAIDLEQLFVGGDPFNVKK